jgi:PAS domain S-box-containing protein
LRGEAHRKGESGEGRVRSQLNVEERGGQKGSRVVRFSLGLRLMVLLAAAILIAVAVVGLESVRAAEEALQDRILHGLDAVATARKHEITSLVEQDFERVALIASRTRLRECLAGIEAGDPQSHQLAATMNQILDDARGSLKDLQEISATDAEGKIVASTNRDLIGENIADSQLFRGGKEGFCLGSLESRGGRLVYDMAAPLAHPEAGTFIGVIVVRIELLRLAEILCDYTGLGETGELVLGKREGDRIQLVGPLRNATMDSASRSLSPDSGTFEPLLLAMARQEGITVAQDYRHVEVLAAYRYVSIGNWGLVAKIDTQEAFQSIATLRSRVALLGSLLAVLGVAAAYLASKVVSRPIRALQTGVERIAGGQLDYRIEVQGRDELGELGRAFNQMAARLEADIAARKQVEQALAVREKEYRTLVEHIPDFVVRYDTDLRRIYVNPAWEEASGLSAREVINTSIADVPRVPKPATAEYVAKLREVLATGTPQAIEFTWVNAYGVILFLEYVIVPEYDQYGQVAGLLCVGHDLSERKRAEEERLAHLRFFESMDKVNRAVQGTGDLEQMISDMLNTLLSIFGCDRVFLLHPCDPYAPTFRVVAEANKPEYPGAFVLNMEIPVTATQVETFNAVLESETSVVLHYAAFQKLEDETPVFDESGFIVPLSALLMAVRPKTGRPWMFGLQQCSYERLWTPQEEQLFQEAGWRLADALTSLLMFRNLQESESKLEDAQRIAHVGHWDHDLDADCISGSDEACRIFGLAPQERLINRARLLELVHPEDRQLVTQLLEDMLHGNPPNELEYRVVWPSGDVRFVHIQLDVERNELGRVHRLFGTVQDITERKRAEEALEQRAWQLALLNEIGRQVAALLDVDEVLDRAAHLVQERFGFHHVGLFTTAIGEDRLVMRARAGEFAPLFPPDHSVALGQGMVGWVGLHGETLLANDVDAEPRYFNPYPDRLPTHAELSVPIRIGAEIVGVLDLQSPQPNAFDPGDVTTLETLAAQMAVAIHNARLYSQAAQHNRELTLLNRVIAATAAAGETLESVLEAVCRELALAFEVPQAAAALFDEEKSEATVVAEYLAPGRPPSLGATIPAAGNPASQHLLMHKTPLAIENAQTDPRLSPIHELMAQRGTVSLLLLPLIVEGEVVGSLGVDAIELRPFSSQEVELAGRVAEQVSGALARARLREEHRQLEEQFRQAQKMEAIGRLAGGIAHDFNNLLTVIHLSTRLLERELHPQDPLCQHVQRIQDAGRRATNLTKQLLAFSRREIVELQILNLNDLIGDLSKMLQRIIGEDVELVMELAEDLWPVEIDPTQVDQVLMNLAVNARDAMPAGGRLTLATANVALDKAYAALHLEAQPGEYVLLSVSDTGVGMSDEVKAHLFEPFFTTKEKGKGTGLGLATVYGIVKQNGGHIGVYSEEGLGTTLRIYLPRAEAKQAETPSPAAPAGTTRGTETILIVEDRADVRDLAVQVLSMRGYQVLAAGDGTEALQVSRGYDGPIHLLLTDLVMPQMDGAELARRLRSQRPETRVLYMSGYADRPLVKEIMDDKGATFLPKPFTLESLAEKVRAVLDRV